MLTTDGTRLGSLATTLSSTIMNYACVTCRIPRSSSVNATLRLHQSVTSTSSLHTDGMHRDTKPAHTPSTRFHIVRRTWRLQGSTTSRTSPAMQAITPVTGMAGHSPTSCLITVTTESSQSTCSDDHRIRFLLHDTTNPLVCLFAHRRSARLTRVLWSMAPKDLRNPVCSTGLQAILVPNARSRHLINPRGAQASLIPSPRSRSQLIYRKPQLEVSPGRRNQYLLTYRGPQVRVSLVPDR